VAENLKKQTRNIGQIQNRDESKTKGGKKRFSEQYYKNTTK
jgi:hypothetical protein